MSGASFEEVGRELRDQTPEIRDEVRSLVREGFPDTRFTNIRVHPQLSWHGDDFVDIWAVHEGEVDAQKRGDPTWSRSRRWATGALKASDFLAPPRNGSDAPHPAREAPRVLGPRPSPTHPNTLLSRGLSFTHVAAGLGHSAGEGRPVLMPRIRDRVRGLVREVVPELHWTN